MSLDRKQEEALTARNTPKNRPNQETERILTLFNCPDITGSHLNFILNTMGEQLLKFEDRKNQIAFENFAFCVNGTISSEIQACPFLEKQVEEFLNTGFDFFMHRVPINYDGALHFVRLASTFSKYFPGKVFLDKATELDKWLQGSNDPKFKALILAHKCILLEQKKELDQADVAALLAADALMTTYGLSEFYKDDAVPIAFKRIRAATKKKKSLSRWQSKGKHNDLLNELTATVDPNAKPQSWDGAYPLFEAGGHRWQLNHASYTTPHGYRSPPSADFTEFRGEKILEGYTNNNEFTFCHTKLGQITRKGNRYFKLSDKEPPSLFYTITWPDIPPHRMRSLVTKETSLPCLTASGEMIFYDLKTGEKTYSLGANGLTHIPLNESEGDWARVAKLTSVKTVIDPKKPFSLKAHQNPQLHNEGWKKTRFGRNRCRRSAPQGIWCASRKHRRRSPFQARFRQEVRSSSRHPVYIPENHPKNQGRFSHSRKPFKGFYL